MILFPTEFSRYFNHTIHKFLTSEYIELRDPENKYDCLDEFFSDDLLHEQPDECFAAAEDLYYWTRDEYEHDMSAIHEMALYNFLHHISALQDDLQCEFYKIYYDEDEDRRQINALWNTQNKRDWQGLADTKKEFTEYIHDLDTIIGHCFDETDFFLLPKLANQRRKGDTRLETLMGIDFNQYKDILPRDIRTQYEAGQLGRETLFDIIGKMLVKIAHGIDMKGWSKEFWDIDGKPVGEKKIQEALERHFSLYLHDKPHIDISRESDIGTGRIDFKFHDNYKDLVVAEIKLGSRNLQQGLVKQLPHYMDAVESRYGYLVVVCYTKQDLGRYRKLIESTKSLDDKLIGICLFDATKKPPASKLR